jgi:transposase
MLSFLESAMRVASTIELNRELRTKLLRAAHSQTASVRLAKRCAIVLLADDGYDNLTIADMLGIGRIQVARWRERFGAGGMTDIEKDLPRGGRPSDPAIEAQIVQMTTQSTPEAATHWSTRTLAKVLGVSDTLVLRVWHKHGLKPHLVRGFKVSRDPKFIEKLEDVVGLYMSPPEQALVLRREEPGTGAGPHAARLAHEEGACGHHDA